MTEATYEVDEIYKYVDFYAYIKEEDIGIGSYEFWGSVYYDEKIVPVIQDDIKWNKSLYTEEENKVIEKYLRLYREEIEEILYENY